MHWLKHIVIWNCFINFVACTVISNLNVIFETFSPLSMVRFFEFNDNGWNITEDCIKDMFLYLDALHKDVLWAVKLYDASGYYAGSIYAGNNIRRGNPQLCRELNRGQKPLHQQAHNNSNTNTSTFDEIQDYLILSQYLPFNVRLVNAKYRFQVEKSPFDAYVIHQTVCMPRSCTTNDLSQVMSYANMPHLRNNLIVKSTELMEVKILRESYSFWKDGIFYMFALITTVLVSLILIGTTFDNCTNFDVKVDLLKIKQQNKFNNQPSLFSATKTAINELTKMEKKRPSDLNYMTMLKMDPMAESLTAHHGHSKKHVNLVQVKKIKVDNSASVSLEIISGKCKNESCPNSKYCGEAPSPRRIKTQIAGHSDGSLRNLLLAFSWRQNFVLLSSEFTEHCITDVVEISGLRVFCVLWIILVHVTTVLYYVADNKVFRSAPGHFSIMDIIIRSGSYSIDTHFFLSGIGVSYMFFRRMKSLPSDDICSCFQHLIHFGTMVMYKMLSLIFPYAIVLMLLQVSMKHFEDFGIIDVPSVDHLTCTENMWRNIFFIDTFFPLEERCMIWSWILSLEVHFFIVASIVLLILRNHPRYGIVICCSFVISSFAATTNIQFVTSEKLNSDLLLEEHLASFNGVYEQPWTRISPYFFGICLGYILHKTDDKLKINVVTLTCGWIACLFLFFAILFSKTVITFSNQWIDATLSVANHTIWSMILFWIILASITQYRGLIGRFVGSKRLLPLSKITNCVLLIYPLISRVIILSSEGTFHLSFGIIMTTFFGFTVIIYCCAFVLYMIYEAPFGQLLRLIYNRHAHKR